MKLRLTVGTDFVDAEGDEAFLSWASSAFSKWLIDSRRAESVDRQRERERVVSELQDLTTELALTRKAVRHLQRRAWSARP